MYARWPKEDVIRWVEWELLRARHGSEREKSPLAENPTDLEVWLAKEKEKKSWKQIGNSFYSKRIKPEARRSEARRAYERVERYLKDPDAREFQGHYLKKRIQEVFGVSANDFRTFILKGYLPRSQPRMRRK